MRIEGIALKLRPRPMNEAADLGVRLVQAHARSVWLTWLPLYGVFAALLLATIEFHDWLPFVLLFCFKPWLDRSLMFVLSRAVFGQSTGFFDLWRAQRSVWWSGLLSTLTMRRLSPWRAYTQAVHQLEGQSGKQARQRRNQILAGKRWPAMRMQWMYSFVELSIYVGLAALAMWLLPDDSGLDPSDWFSDESETTRALIGTLLYALAIGFVEPFFVAAGFAMYLNRRVELEAWDIEQEFRRAFGG